jgi:DNA polymerase III subunit chi
MSQPAAATEAWFYHLQRQSLEQVLPGLLERSLARGWKAVVQAGSPERLAMLDDHLWTYGDDAFLPHAKASEPDAAEEAIVLTLDGANPNGSEVRFLVDGSGLPNDAGGYQRLMLLFDGDDPQALAAARLEWTKAKSAGLAATYWQQDDNGRWEKKA